MTSFVGQGEGTRDDISSRLAVYFDRWGGEQSESHKYRNTQEVHHLWTKSECSAYVEGMRENGINTLGEHLGYGNGL